MKKENTAKERSKIKRDGSNSLIKGKEAKMQRRNKSRKEKIKKRK